MIATRDTGGRYFVCGGSLPRDSMRFQDNSPCYEYEQAEFSRRKDMMNYRTYFSLICLTREDPLVKGSANQEGMYTGNISNFKDIFYPTKI